MSAVIMEKEENTDTGLKSGTISDILGKITGNDSSSFQNKALDFMEDGVLINYSAESPPLGSPEWKEIQLERTLQMRKLRVKNREHNDNNEVNENIRIRSSGSNEIHTILKKTPSNSNSVGTPVILKQPSNSNVTWKEPIAESKLLPLSKSKVTKDEVANALEAPENYNTKIGRLMEQKSNPEGSSDANKLATSKKGSLKPQKMVNLPEEKDKKESKSGTRKDGTDMKKKPPTNKKTRDTASGPTSFHTSAEINQKPKLNKKSLAVFKTLSVATSSPSPSPSRNGKKLAQTSQKRPKGNGTGSPSPSPKNKRKASSSSPTPSPKSNRVSTSVLPDNNNNQVLKKTSETKKVASIVEESPRTPPKSAKRSNSNNNIINVTVQEKEGASTSHPSISPSTSAVKATDNGINSIPSVPEKKSEDPEPRPLPPTGQQTIDKNDNRENGKSLGAFPKLLSTATHIIPLPPTVSLASSYFPHDEPSKKISHRPKALEDLKNGNDKDGGLRKPLHSLLPLEEKKARVNFMESKGSKNRNSSKLRIQELDSLLEKIKPPKLPDIEVCNVLPGTLEWERYWNDFNAKMQDYYGQVERHSRRLDSLLVDDDGLSYKKELAKREQEEKALKLCLGLPPKPPLIKQPLKETIEVGGYVIRPLGGYVPGAFVTTLDHTTFRLEIHVEKIENELENINVDTKYNMMTITVPSLEKGSAFKKLIQITVPNYKKVQNLEVGHPLYNGGRIVVSGK